MVLSAPNAPHLRVVPKPVQNQDGTVRALAKQMLMDIAGDRIDTLVPTATLVMLLETLVDVIDRPTVALVKPQGETFGSMIEKSLP